MSQYQYFKVCTKVITDSQKAVSVLKKIESDFAELQEELGFEINRTQTEDAVSLEAEYGEVLSGWLPHTIDEILKPVDTLGNGSYAAILYNNDFGCFTTCFGACGFQEISPEDVPSDMLFSSGDNWGLTITATEEAWKKVLSFEDMDFKKYIITPEHYYEDTEEFYQVFQQLDEKIMQALFGTEEKNFLRITEYGDCDDVTETEGRYGITISAGRSVKESPESFQIFRKGFYALVNLFQQYDSGATLTLTTSDSDVSALEYEKYFMMSFHADSNQITEPVFYKLVVTA